MIKLFVIVLYFMAIMISACKVTHLLDFLQGQFVLFLFYSSCFVMYLAV